MKSCTKTFKSLTDRYLCVVDLWRALAFPFSIHSTATQPGGCVTSLRLCASMCMCVGWSGEEMCVFWEPVQAVGSRMLQLYIYQGFGWSLTWGLRFPSEQNHGGQIVFHEAYLRLNGFHHETSPALVSLWNCSLKWQRGSPWLAANGTAGVFSIVCELANSRKWTNLTKSVQWCFISMLSFFESVLCSWLGSWPDGHKSK